MVTSRRIGAAVATFALLTAACSSNDSPDPAARSTATDTAPAAGEAARLSLAEERTLRPEGARNPSTAVDPRTGTVYAAWAEEVPVTADSTDDPPLRAVVARSDDGGATFGEPLVVSPAGMRIVSFPVSPTQVEVGPKGEVYVLFLENEDVDLPNYHYGLSFLRLVRSDDGGKTFAAPIDVAPTAREGVSATTMETATLFIAPDGDLLISFLDLREQIAIALDQKAGKSGHGGHDTSRTADRDGDVQLRMVRSTDGGRTFSPSTLVSKPTCACCGTKVTQGRGTPLYAATRSAWKEPNDPPEAEDVRDPFLSVSRDDGATWSGAVKISDDKFRINGCPDVAAGLSTDSKGRLHAAWYTGKKGGPGVYYAVSTDEGRTFSPPVALLTDEWVPPGDVQLVVDDRDRAWVAFEDRRSDVDQIQVVRIDPDGKRTLSPAWPGTAPDLAMAGDDAIVVFGAGGGADEKSGQVGAVVVGRGESAGGESPR